MPLPLSGFITRVSTEVNRFFTVQRARAVSPPFGPRVQQSAGAIPPSRRASASIEERASVSRRSESAQDSACLAPPDYAHLAAVESRQTVQQREQDAMADAQRLQELQAAEIAHQAADEQDSIQLRVVTTAAQLAQEGGAVDDMDPAPEQVQVVLKQVRSDFAWIVSEFRRAGIDADWTKLEERCEGLARPPSTFTNPQAVIQYFFDSVSHDLYVETHPDRRRLDLLSLETRLASLCKVTGVQPPFFYRRIVAAALEKQHLIATGQKEVYDYSEDEPMGSTAPEHPPTDLVECMRAARLMNLDQHGQEYPIVYGERWGLRFKQKIELSVDIAKLTDAEKARLQDAGDQPLPEWNWLEGLQRAARMALAAPLKAQLAQDTLLPEPMTDLIAQYAINSPGPLDSNGRSS